MKKVFFTVLFALICTMGFSQVSFNVKALHSKFHPAQTHK